MALALVWLGGALWPSNALSQGAQSGNAAAGNEITTGTEQLKAARLEVSEHPDSGEAHLHLAKALRHQGRNREAAQEYILAANMQQNLNVAYHELIQITDDPQVLDDAIAQLNDIKDKDPTNLMLRIALSEVYEKRRNYHDAAKALVELQLANAIPPNLVKRLDSRVHYLLNKGKQVNEMHGDVQVATDEELDVVPAPLPNAGLRKGLTASKIKDSKELKGMGHVPLLP
jgi:tetratricopeptide (TPR) repeat protein